jgi:hypothetical protein
VGWAPVPDLGWGRRPKLHGMQGVTAGIGFAVPGRPILAVVAEDRSAERRAAFAPGAGQ